jgi:hypothetical protein
MLTYQAARLEIEFRLNVCKSEGSVNREHAVLCSYEEKVFD